VPRLLRQGTSPSGAIALMDLYREMDVRAILPAIDVPTLVLHRAGDRMIAAAQGHYLANEIPGLGIEVRAGIHTVEVELIGDDVGGMAVNIGARIGALADPGEVLVSSTVRELVVGSGLEFAERGVEKLTGAPGEWRLFAIDSAPA
jgi:class 3 adenylate cyclase